MSDGEARLLTWLAVASALTVALLAVRRELRPVARVAASTQVQGAEVDGWDSLGQTGHRRGPPNARVTLVEFADFQCPLCARFANGALPKALGQFPREVAHVYRHWPLPYHPFATQAAGASECAGEQDRFWEFHDLLYAQQDSIGVKPFDRFANDAGVPDIPRFRECLDSGRWGDRVAEDAQLARAIGAKGTPAFLVNGKLFSGAADSARLVELINLALP